MEKLISKLNRASAQATLPESLEYAELEISQALLNAQSHASFTCKEEFNQYLTESALLNVNVMLSNGIGIPQGEYYIYHIDETRTTLIPRSSLVGETECFDQPMQYDITTSKLLSNWQRAERFISEDNPNLDSGDSKKSRVANTQSIYPRNQAVKAAIEASGKTQEELAAACGVHPSQISRITAKSGDGSRLPSVDLAVCLARQTGIGVEDMFDTVVDAPTGKKNLKSGGGRNPLYRQGNTGEK